MFVFWRYYLFLLVTYIHHPFNCTKCFILELYSAISVPLFRRLITYRMRCDLTSCLPIVPDTLSMHQFGHWKWSSLLSILSSLISTLFKTHSIIRLNHSRWGINQSMVTTVFLRVFVALVMLSFLTVALWRGVTDNNQQYIWIKQSYLIYLFKLSILGLVDKPRNSIISKRLMALTTS